METLFMSNGISTHFNGSKNALDLNALPGIHLHCITMKKK